MQGRQTDKAKGKIMASIKRQGRVVLSWWIPFFIFTLLIGCAPTLKEVPVSKEAVEAEREKQREIALFTHMERQERLSNVAYPLLVAATPLCKKDLQIYCGFEVHDRELYKEEDAAIVARRYRLEKQPTVRYVHPELPAGLAGLQVNDKILEVNGKRPKDVHQVGKIIQEADPSEGRPVDLLIEREDQILEINLPCVKACEYYVQLVTHDSVNAFADGKRVVFTTGLMRFIQSEEELALVASHEIAHNALGHITKKTGNVLLGSIIDILIYATTGADTRGTFGQLGGLVFSKEFEKEADYAGMYIAARAGFDVTNAADLWRRMAAEYPGSIDDTFLATHPSTPERFLAIEKTVSEIKQKQLRGDPLLPEKKSDAKEDRG